MLLLLAVLEGLLAHVDEFVELVAGGELAELVLGELLEGVAVEEGLRLGGVGGVVEGGAVVEGEGGVVGVEGQVGVGVLGGEEAGAFGEEVVVVVFEAD